MRFNYIILALYSLNIAASENRKYMANELELQEVIQYTHSNGDNSQDFTLHSDQCSKSTLFEFISYYRNNGIIQSISQAECYYGIFLYNLI